MTWRRLHWRRLLGLEAETSFTRRVLLLGAAEAGGLVLLGGRLYQIQVLEASRYAPLADDNRLEVEIVPPVRGRILDRSGTVLAANDEIFYASLRSFRGSDLMQSLELLSEIVPLTAEERRSYYEKARRQRAGEPITIARDLTFEQVAAINLNAPQLPGIETGITWRRKYVHGIAAGHIVGHTGRVEQHALDDDPVLRLDGVRVGKAGAERGFDRLLSGEAGSRKFEVDARGRVIRVLDQIEPKAGRDLVLSVDLKLQKAVVERLMREGRAALVVLDARSGEIMAMGSIPTYDPGSLVERTSAEAWRSYGRSADGSLVNRAVSGLYPPGSTFKMVTALAALDAGATHVREQVDCRGSYTLAGQTFRCWKRHGHGDCDLHRALKESCDVYFYDMANRVGIAKIAQMARKLGLGQPYDCGLPGQKSGVVPDADWKKLRFRSAWLGGETILAGIGQGYVLASPLQLAVMTARLATGLAVRPALQLSATRDIPAPPFMPLGIDERWLTTVRQGMVAVVNDDGGTGGNAYIPGGPRIAGKTGTAQVVGNSSRSEDGKGRASGPRDHALFVSYFPADAPRYAIAAVVENGGAGGATAAPLVRDVIELILKDDPASRTMPIARQPVRAETHEAGTQGGRS